MSFFRFVTLEKRGDNSDFERQKRIRFLSGTYPFKAPTSYRNGHLALPARSVEIATLDNPGWVVKISLEIFRKFVEAN